MTIFKAILILTKFRIIFAVIFTGFTGMMMARRSLPQVSEIIDVFFVLLFSASGSAIINNLLDVDIDSRMPRTAKRELAIKAVGRKNLWFISGGMIFLSLIYSLAYLSLMASLLTALAIVSYSIWYTLFLKRKSPFGVILGGLPGALPILIGGYGVSERFAIDIWLLFLWSILWQPVHFWALSLKIRDDYEKAGIPVLPVVYGIEYTKLYFWLYAVPLLPVSLAISFFAGYGYLYTISALVSGAWYLFYSGKKIKQEKYAAAFFASLIYLMLIMLAIIVDILIF